MLLRAPLLLALTLAAACGPEPGVVAPSGVYEVTVETVENDCHPAYDQEVQMLSPLVFAEDGLTLGVTEYLSGPPADERAPLASQVWSQLTPDDDAASYVGSRGDREVQGCRLRVRVEAVVLAEDAVQARVVREWDDLGGCTWLPDRAAGCSVVDEQTYTLVEACEHDCTLEALNERAGELGRPTGE